MVLSCTFQRLHLYQSALACQILKKKKKNEEEKKNDVSTASKVYCLLVLLHMTKYGKK